MRYFKNLWPAFLKNMQLQLFISFISLPFLIKWGLPISLLTPISTLIFTPFLTCFLLISSLIFFLELFYLPNAALIWFLEQINTFWLACLSLEQKSWLIGFPTPPTLALASIPLFALTIIHSKKITSSTIRVTLLAFALIMLCILLKFFPYKHKTVDIISCDNKKIALISRTNALIVIDHHLIASRPSYESFISYTLIPEIIQKTGRMHIDHFVILKFNKRILDALQFLATKITIKNLYIPNWKKKIPAFAWRSYAHLKKTIIANGGNIISISHKKKIYQDKSVLLFVEPISTKDILYFHATYKSLGINGVIDSQPFDLR